MADCTFDDGGEVRFASAQAHDASPDVQTLSALSVTRELSLDALRQLLGRNECRLGGLDVDRLADDDLRRRASWPRKASRPDEPDRHDRRACCEREPRRSAMVRAALELFRRSLREDPEHFSPVQKLGRVRDGGRVAGSPLYGKRAKGLQSTADRRVTPELGLRHVADRPRCGQSEEPRIE